MRWRTAAPLIGIGRLAAAAQDRQVEQPAVSFGVWRGLVRQQLFRSRVSAWQGHLFGFLSSARSPVSVAPSRLQKKSQMSVSLSVDEK